MTLRSFAIRNTAWCRAACLISVLIVNGCVSDSQQASIRQQPSADASSLWTISNGMVDLTVDAKLGRIVSYGFRGERNVLWINSQPRNTKYMPGGWTNYGGDKVWLWPQTYWNWPPPEPPGYSIDTFDDGKALRMTSFAIPGYPVRIIRLIEISPQGTQVIFTTHLQLINGNFDKPLAAWSITQIPWPNRLLLHFSCQADLQVFLRRSLAQDDSFVAAAVDESTAELSHPDVGGGKVLLDADAMTCIYDDLIFIQRQIVVAGQDAWEARQRCQVFRHNDMLDDIPPGPNYGELEWTAPLADADRWNVNPLRVTWQLLRVKPFSLVERLK